MAKAIKDQYLKSPGALLPGLGKKGPVEYTHCGDEGVILQA